MASVTSPVNSVGESVDSLITSAGTTGIMKGAVGARSVSGGDSNVAAVEVASQVDDAAFTPATSTVVVIAGEADETATDSVDEGDAGALRMTLNRRLITAGQLLDDAAFGVATDYVSPIAALADETSPDSVDEGDVGAVRMTLDRRLHVAAAGDVAHDAVDSGAPVKIGGKVSTSAPTAVANGDRVDAFFAPTGALEQGGYMRSPVDGSAFEILPWAHDSANVAPWSTTPRLYNGASLDMARANSEGTVLASAARTATTQSATQTNYNARGLHLIIDVTAISATPSITVDIRAVGSGGAYVLLSSAAITSVSRVVLRIYPGLTALANLIANDILPRAWDVYVNHADTDSITYSVWAEYVL